MVIKNKQAFSLIELLIVMGIVGVLAAIAVPAYQKYQTRVKITKAYLAVKQGVIDNLTTYYQKNGSWPATASFRGVTLGNGGWRVFNNNPDSIHLMTYTRSYTDGRAALIGVCLTGLSTIPNYTEPTNTPGQYGCFDIVIREETPPVMRSICGRPGYLSVAQTIPAGFLPQACQCSNTQNFFVDGSGNC